MMGHLERYYLLSKRIIPLIMLLYPLSSCRMPVGLYVLLFCRIKYILCLDGASLLLWGIS